MKRQLFFLLLCLFWAEPLATAQDRREPLPQEQTYAEGYRDGHLAGYTQGYTEGFNRGVALGGGDRRCQEQLARCQEELNNARRQIEALEVQIDKMRAENRRLAQALRDCLDGDGPPPPPPPPPPPAWDDLPERVEPVEYSIEDVHAHVYPGRWTYGRNSFDSDTPLADAYKYVDARIGDEPVVLGVHGEVGSIGVGSAYSKWSADLLDDKDPEGIEVVCIGLDDGAVVGPVFLGEVYVPVERVEFHDLGIRGHKDSFAIRQRGKANHIVFSNFWIVPHWEIDTYTSGFHLHEDWESLTLHGYQAKGLEFREHCFYLKPGGFTQVLDCELWGGNRTGFQSRSHGAGTWSSGGTFEASPAPHGAFIADGNWANGPGWNHANPDGGQWMTVWCSLEYPVRISNNVCTDARYGCLGILQGPVSGGEPYLTEDGFSHSNVFIFNNRFENNRAERSNVVLAAARNIHFGTGNVFESNRYPLSINNEWAYKYTSARPVSSLNIYGEEALPVFDVWFCEQSTLEYRKLSEEELREMMILSK